MGKPEYARVELRPTHPGGLFAWIDGKVLGEVFTDPDGRVCVRLSVHSLKGLARQAEAMAEDG